MRVWVWPTCFGPIGAACVGQSCPTRRDTAIPVLCICCIAIVWRARWPHIWLFVGSSGQVSLHDRMFVGCWSVPYPAGRQTTIGRKTKTASRSFASSRSLASRSLASRAAAAREPLDVESDEQDVGGAWTSVGESDLTGLVEAADQQAAASMSQV